MPQNVFHLSSKISLERFRTDVTAVCRRGVKQFRRPPVTAGYCETGVALRRARRMIDLLRSYFARQHAVEFIRLRYLNAIACTLRYDTILKHNTRNEIIQEPGSASEPYARQWSMGCLYLLVWITVIFHIILCGWKTF